MKKLIDIINTEYKRNSFNLFEKNFNWNIYRQNEIGDLNIPKNQLNNLIDHLNFFGKIYFSKENMHSVNDEFLMVFIKEEKHYYGKAKTICLNSFTGITFEEYGLSIFKIYTHPSGTYQSHEEFNYLPWDQIDHIDDVEIDSELYLRFYLVDSTSHIDIALNLFDARNPKPLIDLFSKTAKYLQSSDQRIEEELNTIYEKVDKLIRIDQNFQLALDVLESHNKAEEELGYKLSDRSFYHFCKVDCLQKLNMHEECLNFIDNYISDSEASDSLLPFFLLRKAEILKERREYFNSLKCLAESEELDIDTNFKSELNILRGEVVKEIEDNFLQLPKNDRKTLLMSNTVFRSSNESFIALNMGKLSGLNFPIGHPQLNEVYVLHPRRNDYYLPLNNSAEELTLDRISEFETLLQSLGATYLSISSNKSDINEEKTRFKENVNVGVDVKVHGLKVDYSNKQEGDSFSDLDSRISHTQSFKPYKKPFVPDNLVWYHSDLNWQKLARQRFDGNLLEHHETISLSQVENVSSHELKNINVDLKAYFVKAGLKYSKDIEIESKSNKKLTWTVSVNFEDVRNLTETHEPLVSEEIISIDEEICPFRSKYKEDVLFMLEDDGIIDEVERKMLNRKIEKYGLTKEQAEQIEKELMFNNDELKYIDEYKMLMAEGEIGEIEKRMLDRYAKRYNINEERQKILEQNLN